MATNTQKNIKSLGQVFTPKNIVTQMLGLRKNLGNVLEPSCGGGAFFNEIPNCTGIEVDSIFCSEEMNNMNFFEYSTDNKFDTIIGNPPYVRYQDIDDDTKKLLQPWSYSFDKRSNLYLFFIYKCLSHLKPNGELIFITPRDFLKSTSAARLNKLLFCTGTITDIIDFGDENVFGEVTPNCIIWRFQSPNHTYICNHNGVEKDFQYINGQLIFSNTNYSVNFSDLFEVKVGAVSGADDIFTSDDADTEFVCSTTYNDGKTRKMHYNIEHPSLLEHKQRLLDRGIKDFSDNDWFKWGRAHYKSEKARIYVNCKTRNPKPFFTHLCKNYDGSVLALFPKTDSINIEQLKNMLNDVDWNDLGFVCGGRYLFAQKSLENIKLPREFERFL